MALEQLDGRTAVVTGAGSGIGRALAHRLVVEGTHVTAVDIEAAAVDETVATAPDGPGSATTSPVAASTMRKRGPNSEGPYLRASRVPSGDHRASSTRSPSPRSGSGLRC